MPNETFLTEQFGISRGVLREALTILESQGFIRRKPKDGTYIRDDIRAELMNRSVLDIVRKANYHDLMEFREAFELKMVELAIDRASDEAIDELSELLSLPEKDEKPHNIDYYFHYKLAQASENSFFMSLIDMYYDLIAEIAQKSQNDEKRRTEVLAEHTAIAKAIAARDKETARQAMANHIRMVTQRAV